MSHPRCFSRGGKKLRNVARKREGNKGESAKILAVTFDARERDDKGGKKGQRGENARNFGGDVGDTAGFARRGRLARERARGARQRGCRAYLATAEKEAKAWILPASRAALVASARVNRWSMAGASGFANYRHIRPPPSNNFDPLASPV